MPGWHCQKSKQKLSNTESELLLFENYLFSSSMLSTKNNRRHSTKCTKNKCVYFNDIMWSMTLKMRLKISWSSPRHWNNELVSRRVSLRSWGEGASLALVGHPSSDGITIKIPYGVDVLLHQPALHPVFSYWVG